MIPFLLMVPPAPIFICGSWQFGMDDSFDLRKGKSNFVLICRYITQVMFKRSIFATHEYSFLYNSPWNALSKMDAINMDLWLQSSR